MSDQSEEPKPLKLKLSINPSKAKDSTSVASAGEPDVQAQDTPKPNKIGLKSASAAQEESIKATDTAVESTAAKPTLKPALKQATTADDTSNPPKIGIKSASTPTETAPQEKSEPQIKEATAIKPTLKPALKQETAAENNSNPPKVELKPASIADQTSTSTPTEPQSNDSTSNKPNLKPGASPSQTKVAKPSIPSSEAPIEATEQAISEPKKNGSPIASLVIIVVMLAIIGAGGYGIWYLLKGQNDEVASETEGTESTFTETVDDTAPANEDKGPIATTREVISKLPARNETETEVTTSTVTNVEPKEAQLSNRSNGTEPAQTQVLSNELIKEQVSLFLRDVTLGAMRTGTNARVMLNGRNYNIGDVVDESTGLIFRGTKDQKLVFQDREGIYYVKSF